MPERHEKFIRVLCVHVCLSQFSLDRVVKPAMLLLQLPVRKSTSVFSVWTDMWTLGVLQKQESEGEEALWLAGLAGRETPQQERGGLPRTAESQGRTLQRLLWRRSQAVQLPFVQAFPVLEVVVQVLHKIGEVCKSWRQYKGFCRLNIRFNW